MDFIESIIKKHRDKTDERGVDVSTPQVEENNVELNNSDRMLIEELTKTLQQISESNAKKSKIDTVLMTVFYGVVATAVVSLVVFLIRFPLQMNDISEKLGKIEGYTERLGSIEESTKKIDEMATKTDALFQKDVIGASQVSFERGLIQADLVVDPIVQNHTIQYTVYTNSEDGEFTADVADESDNCIVIDRATKNKLTAEDVKGKTVLYPYEDENGNQVIFYGGYDEEMRWNGRCVINIYSDGKLTFINDAIYENGKMHEYQQFSQGTDKYADSWWVQNRYRYDDYNDGETWRYEKTKDFLMEKPMSQITLEDVYTVQRMIQEEVFQVKSYYNGQTSGGVSNDDTGDAYFISYDDNGCILTFYKGRFRDMDFDDPYPTAWEIARADTAGSLYVYYEGRFEKNERLDVHQEGDMDTWNPKDVHKLSEIEQYIKEHNFDPDEYVPMNWNMDVLE